MDNSMAVATRTDSPILQIKDLRTFFDTRDGTVRAVNGVSLELYAGETLCIVGESGCGKSVTAMTILGLLPKPPARIESGEILFEGTDLLKLDEQDMRAIRGNDISMIFQEPMTSLNPVLTIGRQISEVISLHQGVSDRVARDRAVEILDRVRVPDAHQRVKEYPHQLSGGMRQRAMIAMALSCNPKILIADEPSTALDVTIQAQILDLMRELRDDFGTSIILITHDLGVVAEMGERVLVMYAGGKVEEASVEELFHYPLHPYSEGLMTSIPRLNESLAGDGDRVRLQEIPGMVPSLIEQSQVVCSRLDVVTPPRSARLNLRN
jgi:oligopeptide/dipeptide ABC transporter ATP-binding protein